MNKNMKAGYQGKPDAMREKAERLLNHPGHAADVYYSKSCADKDRMRPYKEGGAVKKEEMESYKNGGVMEKHHMEDRKKIKKHKKDCQKFAMGGVAKIRHDEATSDGMPTKPKKKSIKYFL